MVYGRLSRAQLWQGWEGHVCRQKVFGSHVDQGLFVCTIRMFCVFLLGAPASSRSPKTQECNGVGGGGGWGIWWLSGLRWIDSELPGRWTAGCINYSCQSS